MSDSDPRGCLKSLVTSGIAGGGGDRINKRFLILNVQDSFPKPSPFVLSPRTLDYDRLTARPATYGGSSAVYPYVNSNF